MPKHFFVTGEEESLSALMNACCQGKRNYSTVSRNEIRQILARGRRGTAGKLLMLSDEHRPLGACHVFTLGKERQGYLAYLLSVPGEEHMVWPLLIDAAHSALSAATSITIGSPYTPLYQAVEGRFQPLWGGTETLEVSGADTLLKEFLWQRGYVDRENYVTMTKQLSFLEQDSTLSLRLLPDGLVFEILRGDDCWYNAYDWYGQNSAGEFGLRNESLSAYVLRKGHRIIGHTAWYPMLQAGSAALCDFEVRREARGQGIGKLLLRHTLQQLRRDGYRTCELFVNPRQSPEAHALYHRASFQDEATWHELTRPG
ncbi:MAG: GNAT family N-acetyltransferase [Firmicutes bacterium]|nr:GNAT family N-acetyltransferase [Dethiobacter sp.]MBS3887924.1 GNAT family N-acetyltransferase [Bacillota bacterium]MBS4054236.1 GNAT family N-acetyltransferase [Thermaerobacter sp.]